jgi:hypothetical protein
MKNKKGLQMDYLGWILIALGVLILASFIILSNKNAISGILSRFKI